MSIYRFAFFCAVAGASPAFAAPFNIESTGGVFSYTANVTHRLGAGQNLVTQTTGTTNAGTQAGVPANITDFSRNTWQMGGNFDSTKLNTTVTELDKIYDLNKIHTQYLDYLPQTYNLRTSIDGVNWSALVTGGTPTSLKFDTFTTRQVKYIEWQMVGPGADLGGVFYAYQTELQAFVDAASTDIPQREGGYNILPAGTIFATSGTSLTEVYDEDFRNFAIPGLGMHLVESATQRDYSLTMGLTMFYTFILCAMNFLVDVFYKLLDPRIQLEA